MAISQTVTGFHSQASALDKKFIGFYPGTKFTYTFENFFHPFVGELIAKLNRDSLPGMLDAAWQDSLSQLDPDFFKKLYNPTDSDTVKVVSFPKEIDVAEDGPYANYNWELFFHVPLTIAVHLSKNQRFAEAQRWFHYIFDPTSNDHSVEPHKRFWKFLAFRQDKDPTQIDELLRLLSDTATDPKVRQKILDGYQAILDHPFEPHRVARTRHVAYQYCVVMKYLDNLIAWGDQLFQQDTVESINEATQRYVLAANLLGPRPQRIPPRGAVQPKTFAQLKGRLDPMGNALVDLEGQFPFNLASPVTGPGSDDGAGASPLFGIGRTLYFCIPRNDKMLGYWDTVADRLFKIRHCMNIEGIVRPLALFDPPIDPGMLVKAAAAGIDIGSIVSGLNQPIGPVRCPILIQNALELAGEVRGLGSALLSALEKGDGEHLALIRQRHEIQIQQMAQEVRFLQWKSAQEATTSLLTARATALERLHYYQRLLGLPADQNAPDTLPLDHSAKPDDPPKLTAENFDEAYSGLVGQYDRLIAVQKLPDVKIAGDASPTILSGASGWGKLYLSANEDAELNTHLPIARDTSVLATAASAIASGFTIVSDADGDVHFWGIGGKVKLKIGTALVEAAKIAGDIFAITTKWEEAQATMASKTASYERRAGE